ncbi:MAG: Alcohol dehydrogenase GroES domain protein [Phycisphaerales bacterium]|nr:Alcohol dehydrogenase GroES domain protein [Phycisphaerales bacterium]
MQLQHIAPIESSPLRDVELPDPLPAIGELRLRVKCCAICRTDLHVIEGDLPTAKLPIIPGHQVVGIVDALGPGCTRFKPGDRAGIAWLRHTDGVCKYCTSGRENLCPDSRYTGYHADGGYAQYALVPEDFAYTIPDVYSDVEAAPLLCAGIIGYRAMLRSGIRPGGKLALYGFGSSAHVVLQLARRRGCEVYVVTRGESHRQFARDLGAAWVGANAADMPAKADAAILFAPAGTLVPPALAALDRGGALALAGIHMSPIPPLDYDTYLFQERDIHPVTANTRADGRDLLAEAARVPVRPHAVTYPLGEANRALQDMKTDRIDGTGVLIVDGA